MGLMLSLSVTLNMVLIVLVVRCTVTATRMRASRDRWEQFYREEETAHAETRVKHRSLRSSLSDLLKKG